MLKDDSQLNNMDLIYFLYKNQLISESDPEKLNNEQIMNMFNTLYAGGTDTVTAMAMMAIWYITQDKRVYKKLMDELNEVIKSDDDINKENLS